MEEHEHEGEMSLKKVAFAVLLFVAALLLEKLPFFDFSADRDHVRYLIVRGAYLVLYFAAYFIVGFPVVKEAVEDLFHGEFFGEEFLMSVATLGAVAIGEYSEAVAVMLLFQIGEYLEDKAVDSSRRSITELMDIRPDTATVRRGAALEELPAEEVRIGEVIVVKPGERIPLDGTVVSGKSMLDTSALTGESVPREVLAGDAVLSGFVNNDGALEVRVTKAAGESTVSRILDMVEKAQDKKARSEKFMTRFAKVYTPIVCFVALLVAVVPPLVIPLVTGQNGGNGSALWRTWIYRALELLVVSCPCAFVISVPLSFFAGIGRASRSGILVKGSNYMESLSKTDCVVFDKTGTLTKGVFEVVAVHPVDERRVGRDALVAFAAHAEYYSNHPISKSLKQVHHCPVCDKMLLSGMSGAEEISGHGVKTFVQGQTVLAGNMRLMEKEGVMGFVPCSEDDSGTVVHVAVDGIYAGHIVISDVVKEDAKTVVDRLHKAGVTQTVMLTGDEKQTAETVASRLKLDTFYAELLPQDKVSKLEQLLSQYKAKKRTVAFVGDGINDAPVLSRSDVGIAMGGIGSDAAIEAADVVIMDDLPGKVAEVITLSRRTMANVRQNICFALGVKLLIMLLCVLGLANMWLAVFGDTGVTLLAALNSMRLLKE